MKAQRLMPLKITKRGKPLCRFLCIKMCRGQKKKAEQNVPPCFFYQLFGGFDRAGRATVFASAAIDANVGINDVLCIAFGNC